MCPLSRRPGPRRGAPVRRLGNIRKPEEEFAESTGPRCAAYKYFSLHADVFVPAGNDEKLARLIGPLNGVTLSHSIWGDPLSVALPLQMVDFH